MIKKIILVLLTSIISAVLITGCGSSVYAQTKPASPSGTKVSEKLVKTQSSLDRIINHLEGITKRVDKILDNLQKKIIRAKSGGKDITYIESLMKDSRERLVVVNSDISDLKTMKEVSKTRADYQKIRDQVKKIKDNLQTIRKNISETIAALKSSN